MKTMPQHTAPRCLPLLKPRILLADPDDLERGMNEVALGQLGLEAQGTETVEMALRLAGTSRYDVLIVQHSPARMEAGSLIRRLREQGVNTPAVVLCGASEQHGLMRELGSDILCTLPGRSAAGLISLGIQHALQKQSLIILQS